MMEKLIAFLSLFTSTGTLLCCALPAALLGAAGPSDTRLVRVEVKGLACPFCAYGLEKRLKETGAGKVRIYVDKGLAEAVYPEKRPLDVDGLKEAVKKGGFTPGGIQIQARGSISGKEGRWIFELAGSGETFFLKEDENLKELLKENKPGSLIRLSAKVGDPEEGHGERPPLLAVLKHEIIR